MKNKIKENIALCIILFMVLLIISWMASITTDDDYIEGSVSIQVEKN